MVVGWTFTSFVDRAVLFEVDGWSESFSRPRPEACLEVIEVSDDPPRKTATVEPAQCPDRVPSAQTPVTRDNVM
jgi:hypothetical protein